MTTIASPMRRGNHYHPVRISKRSMLAKPKPRWAIPLTMTSSVVFFGCLSIAVLNFVHNHRFIQGLESRTRGPPLHDSVKVKDKPPEVSACLIVMDDNHILIEWLAYHYHTANLRHLIITSDPHSRTSPSKILDRWRDRINIQEWNETNFLPSDFDDQVKKTSFDEKTKKLLQNHRVRQANFNLECLKEFKRQKSGWTLLIDTDEYLIPREDPAKNRTKAVTPIVSDVLRALHIPAGFEKIYSPCIPINREQFSTRESSDEKVQSLVAPGFDGMDFQTMRWRKHGQGEMVWFETKFDRDKCGILRDIPNKVMIDLGQVTLEDLSSDKNSGNPHRPLDICDTNVYSKLRQTPFVLHHYMGTPEQWFYRSNDKRGVGFRGAKYEDMNERFGAKESDAIRPWLTDFVALGSDEASRLLEGVGKTEPFPGAGSKANFTVNHSYNKYEVGDLVEVNFAGEGEWYQAEIYSAYSNNYYSVFFDDCEQEIATFDERMRPMAATNKSTDQIE